MGDKTPWTPGPWLVTRDANHAGNCRVVSFHPAAVAKVYADEPIPNDEKAIANARLIAAAPDLYEALNVTLRMLEAAQRRIGMRPDDSPRIVTSRAALAKATEK